MIYFCKKVKTMEEKRLLDYQELYDELIENDYLPARIDYQWSDENEDFMREVFYAIYNTYNKLQQEDLVNPMLRLYSDIILAAHTHFSNDKPKFF